MSETAKFEDWAIELQCAYIAGLFDGEGCVYISRKKSTGVSPSYGLHVSVSNCHRGIVEILQKQYGGYIKRHTETRPNHQDCYSWQLCGGRMATEFLSTIRKYSIIKAVQIDLALEFAGRITERASYRITEKEIAVRDAYKTKLSKMKRLPNGKSAEYV